MKSEFKIRLGDICYHLMIIGAIIILISVLVSELDIDTNYIWYIIKKKINKKTKNEEIK
ncbi:hypothetical protein [Romboutsia sp.]|uniref:hypothetical protein n=1 Tax=Romboutsia sp. TaxID=1965302 RepID=UPI003F678C1C